MKINKFVIVLLVIALFIPTYIGIANYLYIKNTPVTYQTATEIEIKDNISGLLFNEKPDSSIAKLFAQISTDTKTIKIDSLPDGLSGENNYIVTSISGDRRTDSFYYFLKDSGTGYYVDDKGTAYKIDESYVAAFLETKYAQSLYEEAKLPTLTSAGKEIIPSNYTWTYHTLSGEASFESSVSKKSNLVEKYLNESGADLEFSRQPDSFIVSVNNESGISLYEGEYSAASGLDSSILVFNATAIWNESETMPYGSATYSFVVEITAAPSFDICFSGKEGGVFEPGDMVFVSAFDVASPDKITFTSEPELAHSGEKIVPKFYSDGKNAYAIIPTTYETAPGNYKFVFNYSGKDFEFDVTVAEKWFNANSAFNVKENIAHYTDATKTEYNAFVAELIANNDFSTKYFTSEVFGSVTAQSKARGYGKERPVTGAKYIPDGMDYTTSGKIVADMDGKVVAVRYTELAGDTVVIDHGYGVLSFFRCLDGESIKVAEGQIVKRGDEIAGKVGGNCFTDGSTLRYAVTVNSVPVNPSDLWEAPIAFK